MELLPLKWCFFSIILVAPIDIVVMISVWMSCLIAEVTVVRLITVNCRSAMMYHQANDIHYCLNMMRLKIMQKIVTLSTIHGKQALLCRSGDFSYEKD